MMNKQEIVEKLAKDKFIENIVFNNIIKSPYFEDLCQDLYIDLLSKKDDLIVKLYNNDSLEYFIRKMITNNIFSKNSPYYKKYKEFRKITEPIFYDENGEEKNIKISE